ncbi:family S53 protease [Mycena alexandri]|uniref:Family S53 protease n=1 Tax=Mycena alexandri TaxID=1745969 RepID=A0AAD6X9H5_9AGAR|nr:family S53 protease [Mycena alexandri]
MFKSLSILGALAVVVGAEFTVIARRENPPTGFSRVGSSAADQTLNLRLALVQKNISGLQDTVYGVSTPGSSRYGQYLSKEEVEAYVAPTDDSVSQVNAWLASNNLTSSPMTSAGDWIAVNMSVSQANQLFAADFSTFQNEDTNQTVHRTLSYSVPRTLRASIKAVHPTTTFPVTLERKLSSSVANTTATTTKAAPLRASITPDCILSWTPACFQALYGIPSTPAAPAANVFAVAGFQNDFANLRDVQAFLQTFRPDLNPNPTVTLISVDDGINNQLPAGAGPITINMEIATALTNGVSVAYISTGSVDNDIFSEFLDEANFLVSSPNLPQTIVQPGTYRESLISPEIAESLCNSYAQLAARGVSYIMATGLWGAGGPGPLPNCVPFDAPFPASCPFVTAVGGTEWTTDDTAEAAWSPSGGGFSRIFSRPKYQDEVVPAYLSTIGATPSSPFNISGRGIPDLAAMNQATYIDQGVTRTDSSGTDNSATIFASMIALLTNERIAAGKPGLGFLNPLIYQNKGAFNDISAAIGESSACQRVFFNGTTGWDPVTGFGSPSYTKLQEVCNKL